MLRTAALFGLCLVWLAGCAVPPPGNARREERPGDWVMPGTETPAPPPSTNFVVLPSLSSNAPVAALTSAPAPLRQPETTWLSLDRWSQQHGLGPARPLALTPMESYGLLTPKGTLVVSVGSVEAYWDGSELRLGFAPQIIGGQIFLHALDVRKSLEPLLRGFAGFARTHRVIVLDPGHGGGNTGAQSVVDGRFEKEFTLDWALRLAPLLERSGWRVFLTRTNDAEVSLPDRVAFAERQDADLFLSLHFNSAAPNREAAGLETYCLTPVGMPSSLTRGYPDDPAQGFPNNAFDEQNLQCAFRLHHALLEVNGNADRGVCRARFLGVLRGQNRPAVLVEGGYLSNPREAGWIGAPAYRQQLADAIAKALE